METQQQTAEPTKAPHQTKKSDGNPTSFTVFELETMKSVISTRGNTGVGFKDIRLLSNVAKRVSSFIPNQAEPPKQSPTATEEDKKAYVEAVKAWQQSLEERIERVVDTDFTAAEFMTIRNKLRTFPHYSTDEDVRERLVAMFDKLGIQ